MSLAPPQAFRKVEFIHRIGLAADRPAAADVLIGTLYFSIDTLALDRSNGTTWATYTPSAGGVTDPLFVSTVIGGTGTTSTLTLQSTSGVGVDAAAVIIKVGNNGATEAARFRGDAILLPNDRWIYGLHPNGITDRKLIRMNPVDDGSGLYTDHTELGCAIDRPVTGNENGPLWISQAYVRRDIIAGYTSTSNAQIGFYLRCIMTSAGDGIYTFKNWTETDFDRIQLGGTTSSFPALKRNTIILETKLADNSDYAQHTAKFLGVVDSITAPATQAGKALIYVDSADNDLKVKFGSGTVNSLTASGGTPVAHHASHETGGSDAITALSGSVVTTGTVVDARLSSNVALKNTDNAFSADQSVSKTDPTIILNDSSQGTDLKKFRVIGSTQNLYVQTTNDAGAALVTSLQMNRSGDLAVGRNLSTSGSIASGTNIVGGSYVYATSDLYGATGIYERSRSVKLGEWTAMASTVYASVGTVTVNTVYACNYTLVGKTCVCNVYLAITTTNVSQYLYMATPAGITVLTSAMGAYAHNAGMAPITVAPGTGVIYFYRDITGTGTWPVGVNTIAGSITFPFS